MSFFGGRKCSDVSVFPVNPNFGQEIVRWTGVNTLWEVIFAFIALAVAGVVFGSSQPEIAPDVVAGIQIPVIDREPIWNLYSHQNKDDLVNVESSLNAVKTEGNDIIGGFTIGPEGRSSGDLPGVMVVMPAPFYFSFEMLSWPLGPSEFPGCGIVGKRFAETLAKGYHIGSRDIGFVHCADFSVRREGATTPITPPVYPTKTWKATPDG